MSTKSDAPIGVSDTVKLRGSDQTMIVDSFVDPVITAAKSADYGPGSSNPGGVAPARQATTETPPVVMVNCIWINAAGMPVEHAFDVRHLDVVSAAAKDAPGPAPAPAPTPVPPAPPLHP